jgi:hypothetical protein
MARPRKEPARDIRIRKRVFDLLLENLTEEIGRRKTILSEIDYASEALEMGMAVMKAQNHG